jgi:hypothetical protein
MMFIISTTAETLSTTIQKRGRARNLKLDVDMIKLSFSTFPKVFMGTIQGRNDCIIALPG